MGIVLLVFSYSRWGRDRLQVLTGSVVTLAGLGGVAMTTLVNPEVTQTYYLGLILTMLFGFTVAQMRWRAANAMAGTIVLAYELVALDSLPTLQLIHNNFYLLAGVIIGLIACWQTERFHRREFLQLREIDAQRTALADANDRLEAEASRDPLTGLQNRRHLTERILEAAGMAERYGIPTTLVLMDMDRFKRVNDTFGHPVGDALLRTVARTLASTVRDTDRLFRIGGDEFLVLLLGTPLETAYGAVARMEAILDGVFQVGPWSELGLGVSTGIVLVDPKLTPEKNVEAADRSMYTVKTPEER